MTIALICRILLPSVAKCASRVYKRGMTEEGKEMSAVGKRLWLHMQEKGPYNRRAFSRMLTRTNILRTNHQNISNWLSKEHPPPGFVNAAVAALGLTEEEEIDLHYTYFYGEPRPDARNIAAARAVEERTSRVESGAAKTIGGHEHGSENRAS